MLKLQRPQQYEAENVGWEEGQCATEQGRPTRSQQAVELAHDGCGEQAETCTPSGRSTCLDTTSPLETRIARKGCSAAAHHLEMPGKPTEVEIIDFPLLYTAFTPATSSCS